MVKSGQTDFNTVAILRWDPATAQRRMEDLLTSTYGGGAKVHGVLSPYDGLSIGILSALKSNGYGTAGQPYPIVTGQDAEVASVKSIIAGEQFSTDLQGHPPARRRHREDGRRRAQGRQARGQQHHRLRQRHQGRAVVLLQPVIVYKDNYQKVLVDSGYYTADQLQ